MSAQRRQREKIELLLRDGNLCHLCGFPMDSFTGCRISAHPNTKRMVPSRWAVSKDHLVPNPFTRQSRYRKRTFLESGIDNIRLAHRYCNAVRGQQPISDSLKIKIKTSIAARYSATMDQFAQFDRDFRIWRESFDTNLTNTRKRTATNETSQSQVV